MAKKLMNTYVETLTLKTKEVIPPAFEDRSQLPEEHIENLRVSIKEHGQMMNIWVRIVDGKYMRIAGRCRLEALQRAGIKEVKADVFDVNEEQAYTLSTLENDHREGRPPLDRIRALVHQTSIAYARLLKRGKAKTEIRIEGVMEHAYSKTQSATDASERLTQTAFAKIIAAALKRTSFDSDSSDPDDYLIKEAFQDSIRAYNMSEGWAYKQLSLFDLPVEIINFVDAGKLSISAAVEMQKGLVRLRGRKERPDAKRVEAIKALREYVVDACKNKADETDSALSAREIRDKVEELFAQAGKKTVGEKELLKRLGDVQRELKSSRFTKRDALAVDTLLKRIEKLIKKSKGTLDAAK